MSIDEQTVLINSNGSTRSALDRTGFPLGDVTITVKRTDPVKVNVNFYLNSKNELYITGPVTPGESHLQRPPDRLATEKDKRLFSQQYQAFLQNKDQFRTGTLLDIIFPHDKAKVQRYYRVNIFNVEQLADVNEAVIASNPEISPEDKKLAQRFLRYQLFEKHLQGKDEIIARQEQEIAELRAQLTNQSGHKQRPRL